jgi:hypothetical protein
MTRILVQDPIYLICGKLLKETPKAVYIRVDSVEDNELTVPQNEWFPKSQIVDQKLADPVFEPDTLDRFNAKRWIMQEKGLLKYAEGKIQ